MIWNPGNLQTYEDYRDALLDIINGGGVSEPSKPAIIQKPDISERLVQTIWYEKQFRNRDMKTLSGKPVRVINSGRWNQESGPDFSAAEIELDGNSIKGDVEIHVHAADWLRHDHDKNFDFNRCILHVFLFLDDDKIHDTLFDGSQMERLHLEPYLLADIDTVKQTLTADDYHYSDEEHVGRCADVILHLDPDFLGKFLDFAGDRRIEEKALRLSYQMSGENYDQVFYQALMTAMGYKGSKTLFFLLSKRAPLHDLMDFSHNKSLEDRILIIQSILFHVANLIPSGSESYKEMDEETLAYVNQLNRWWIELSGYFSDRVLPSTKKWFAKVRPANFPTRRIAGIARMISKLAGKGRPVEGFVTLFRNGANANLNRNEIRHFLKDLEDLLIVKEDPYWSYRFNFTSKKSSRKLTLIGKNRARSILFNAILPMMLLKGRADSDRVLEDFTWKCVQNFPSLPDNVVLKFMRRRLFGGDDQAKNWVFNERRQQALFKIFYDCCNSNEVSCDDCYFYRQGVESL